MNAFNYAVDVTVGATGPLRTSPREDMLKYLNDDELAKRGPIWAARYHVKPKHIQEVLNSRPWIDQAVTRGTTDFIVKR
jgi:hypothetical protein